METAARRLLPGMRRTEITVPRRHGVVRNEPGSYNTRQIAIEICFIKDNQPDLQLAARDVAGWLRDKGALRFDDEPDKHYDAWITGPVDVEQQLTRLKRASVVFDCQPFAYGKQVILPIETGVNAIHYDGTAETPTLIVLRNTSAADAVNVTLTAVRMKK